MTRRVDLSEAQTFLDALAPEGAVTFQTFDDSAAKRREMAQVMHGTLDECAIRLQRLNDAGAGVFVTVNETDGRGREYSNIVRVRALFVDLDGAPIEPVRDGPLAPHLVVESSPGRWHAYWLVEGVALEQFRPLQRGLIARFGGDKVCVDLPRVMRLPGFVHRKAEPFQTRVADYNALPPYSLAEVLEAFEWASAEDAEPKRTAAPPVTPGARMTSTADDVVDDLRDALRSVPSDDYDVWIRVGHALKTLGHAGVPLWLEWSGKSAKFDMNVALKRWESFKPSQTGHAVVFAEAKLHGWDPRRAPSIERKRSVRHAAAATPPPPAEGAEAPPEGEKSTGVDRAPEALVARYELIYGTKQVWDTRLSVAMRYEAFSALVGGKAASAWLNDERRRVRMMPAPGGRKKDDDRDDGSTATKVEWMLPRYALIYGDEAVFDRLKRRELTLGALRAYAGLKAVRDWGDHPKRDVVDQEQVIFDPRLPFDDTRYCNLWGGWPIEAAAGSVEDQELVKRWLRVLHYAVGESDAVFDWILKWIAYPVSLA